VGDVCVGAVKLKVIPRSLQFKPGDVG